MPGVYVDAGASPLIAPVGVDPTLVCLIGAGVGFHTFSETINFTGGNVGTLTQKGIIPNSVVLTGFIADPNATSQSIPYTFVADIPGSPPTINDYSVSQTGSGTNTVTTITRETAGKISLVYPAVTVSYKYTDANYYGLHFFNDYTSFTEAYGPAFDPVSGNLVSPLSLAAQIAMLNGANQLYAIALEGGGATIQQQFADAYTLLSTTNTTANVIVPLWDGVTDSSQLSGMLATLKAFVEGDANNLGILRMAVVGFDQLYAPSVSALASLALNVASSRVVLAWPNQVNFYNGVTTTTQILDGFYLATAYAGLLSSQTPQTPLTRKFPQGFTGLPIAVAQSLITTTKNQLSSSGISVSDIDRRNRLVVRQGLTSNYAGGILAREISLVRAQDALYQLIDQNLDTAALVGTPISANTALQVKSIVSGGLETAKASGLIVDYNQLAVREQQPPSGDPTIIQVMFAYKPSWPLNYILVSFTVDTSTGATTLSTVNTAGQNTPNQTGILTGSS